MESQKCAHTHAGVGEGGAVANYATVYTRARACPNQPAKPGPAGQSPRAWVDSPRAWVYPDGIGCALHWDSSGDWGGARRRRGAYSGGMGGSMDL